MEKSEPSVRRGAGGGRTADVLRLLLMLGLAAALMTGCKKQPETAVEASAQISSEDALLSEAAEDTELTQEELAAYAGEEYPGTVAVQDVNEEGSACFGVMHATVVELEKDAQSGVTQYTLQDHNDMENVWYLSGTEIGDVTLEVEKGDDVALLFHGDIIAASEDVEFIAIVPEGNYSIERVSGTTINNMMGSFTLRTERGEELSFRKDNCKTEENAMQQDSGDHIVVYYAKSDAEDTNYPLKIYKAN